MEIPRRVQEESKVLLSGVASGAMLDGFMISVVGCDVASCDSLIRRIRGEDVGENTLLVRVQVQ